MSYAHRHGSVLRRISRVSETRRAAGIRELKSEGSEIQNLVKISEKIHMKSSAWCLINVNLKM